MKKVIICVVLAGLGYIMLLHLNKFQSAPIENVGNDQIVTLVSKEKGVYNLEAYIEGHLDDTAKIGTLFIGKGRVNTCLHTGDCYVDTVRYVYTMVRNDFRLASARGGDI